MREAVVCLPTYNERENLPSLIDEILHTAAVDVIVVDDNSPDGTGVVADLIAAREPRVTVLHRERKLGLGSAYLAAFEVALARGYPRVLEMDADFSHQPRVIPELLRAAEGADLVLGSRYVPGGGSQNRGIVQSALSRCASVYARGVLGLPFHDVTSGFKCFRREVLEAIDLASVTSAGYAFQIDLTYRAHKLGFRIREVPIVFQQREAGSSKMSRTLVVEAVTKVWRMRFSDE